MGVNTQRIQKTLLAFSVVVLWAGTALGSPATYTYASWTSDTTSSSTTAGSASGSLTIGTNTIAISYAGDLAFAQVGAGGIDYYIPASVYTNSQVANVPTNNNLIALSESFKGTNSLTFSSPLLNPILDIVSLGSPGNAVTYTFDAKPTILSQGAAYWGGCSTCLSVSGDALSGAEGSGVIEFLGSYSSLSWTTTGGEFWNGLTVGVQGLGSSTGPTTTPEPATFGLLAVAAAFLTAVVRRRSRDLN